MPAEQGSRRISRRRMLAYAGVLAAGPLVTGSFGSSASASPLLLGENALADPRYQDGAQLMTVVPSTTPVETLDFGTTPSGKPQWQIAEWWTKNSLAGTDPVVYRPGSVPGLSFPGIGYESRDHRIIRGFDGEFWLSYDARDFYGSVPRADGQQWPELHLSQYWQLPDVTAKPLRLVDLSRLTLAFQVRVPYLINYMAPKDYNPDLHTAQAWIYMTVQNLNSTSTDYGKYIWFGIPIVDYRYDIPPGYTAGDNGHPGSTGQIIEDLPGTDFWTSSLKDGQWHRTQRDLLPLMHEVFASAQKFGYLPASTIDDMQVASFDVSWEFPGTFAAAMEFLSIELRPTMR